MTTARRAITVVQSIDNIRSQAGPFLEEYFYPLDLPALFRWSRDSALEDDGWSVLEMSGGFPGALLRVVEDIKGENITGSETITVGGKPYRRITALSANATLALSTTNARAGMKILFVRSDTSAYTVDIGGLVTMPVSVGSWVVVYFSDAGAWEAGPSGLSL
jgi:hypothetical protein